MKEAENDHEKFRILLQDDPFGQDAVQRAFDAAVARVEGLAVVVHRVR